MNETTGKQEQGASAQVIGLPELGSGTGAGAPLLGANPALLDSVKVALGVIVGEAETTLGELMALREGAVLRTARVVDSPVDVVINGNVVARGQLVAVDDYFGVRITEVAAHQS